MANWYYYNKNGEKVGPISVTALKSLAQQGMITRTTVIENHTGRTAIAGEVNGLTFPEIIQPEATAIPPVEPGPFSPSPSSGNNPFVNSPNPFNPSPTGPSPFTQSVSMPMTPSVSSSTDIQPISTELLGMKPEVLFTFMYLATIFSFSIITTFIPIVIWALTKEKDKRADLHGKTLIGLIIVYAVTAILFFAVFSMFRGLDALIFGLPLFIVMCMCLAWLIAGAFYAAYGYVPSNSKDFPGSKSWWAYAPTPIAVPSTPQPSSPTVSSATTSPVDEIRKMKELLDCGAITQDEFDTFKKRTLGI